MFYEPGPKLFCHHSLAGHRKFLRPLLINSDTIAAGAGKGEIDQFNLEPIPGLMVKEVEGIMRIWAGHLPSYRWKAEMARHKYNFPMHPKMHVHVHGRTHRSNSR